jgi:hypothetical protein
MILYNHINRDKGREGRVKRYKLVFLIIGLILSVSIFFVSQALFPEWRQNGRLLLALAALAIVSAFGFLANFRQAIEKPNDTSEGQFG